MSRFQARPADFSNTVTGPPASDTTTSIAKAKKSKTWLGGITFALPSRRRKTSEVEAPPKAPKKSKGSLGLSTLYEPPDGVVIAEMIFVHGLGGNSTKTWCDSLDPTTAPICWPRDWLPADPEFKHVRIHTFGYDADWRERTPSILSVHDFAQSLLGEIKNHQLIKRSDAGIVLVGHSMGGCVAKKTYILARQDTTCADLASRFHSMFFLATPHRGSELGKVLRNLLLVTGVSKPYVKDLVANSGPVLEVNEQFHQYASDLHLWSFYEARPMSDYSNIFVVDKHSATLGFDNESVSFLDADHRTICKFKYQSDHNYKKLRNALSSAIEMIRTTSPQMIAKSRLSPYLGVDDSFEDDIYMLRNIRHPGSCDWVIQDPGFCNWIQCHPESPPIRWLVARMGTGKSIICSRVIDHLQSESKRCSYFFIKRERADMQDLLALLMSLALQMALQDVEIRRAIFRLQDDGVSWENQNDKFVWRKLFQETIFKVESSASHFWVIDGLDECSKAPDLLQFLGQAPPHLRIFVTSQNTTEMEREMISLDQKVSVWPVIPEDTVADMKSFVEASLLQISHLEINDLSSRIVDKSRGSFMWIYLVLKELLENAFTYQDAEEILDEVPNDLQEMYARILKSIERKRRQAKLAKPILTWVTLAIRPMTVDELRDVLQLDLQVSPQKILHAIVAACGPFVVIDQSYRLHLVHETARQFLCRSNAESQFSVVPTTDHGRLAELCMAYLTDNLKIDQPDSHVEPSFLWYAAECFTQHLTKSNLEGSVPLSTLRQFLDKWALHWIEIVAKKRKLGIAVRSAIDLDNYTEYAKQQGTWPRQDLERIRDWTTDIPRVVLNFREPLLKCPSSIHSLVPSFCPTQSAIYRNAPHLSQEGSLTVISQQGQKWNDCLTCIEHGVFVETVVCGEQNLAIGLSTGIISVYDITLLQNTAELKFPHSHLRSLGFGIEDKYLAATSSSNVVIWDIKTEKIFHSFDCDSLISFTFNLFHFTIVTSSGVIESRNLKTLEVNTRQWRSFGGNPSGTHFPLSAASKAMFNQSNPQYFGLTFYGSGDIYLLDIDASCIQGVLREPTSSAVKSFSFNPDPEKHLIVASYIDGGLAIFDSNNMNQIYFKPDLFSNHVSWTTDGKYLLVGSGETTYTIELYKFKTTGFIDLVLSYQADHPGIPITPFVLASQGSRIVSAHTRQSRVWEFPVLEEREIVTTNAEENQPDLLPRQLWAMTGSRKANIVVMALSDDGQFVICGTEAGEIVAFSALDGSRIALLYHKHDCEISSLNLIQGDEQNFIVSGDQDGYVVVAKALHNKQKWDGVEIVLEKRCGIFVESILVNPSKNRLLVISLSTSELWELPSGELINSLRVPRGSANLRRAVQFPLMDDRFIILEDSLSHIFYWHDFERSPEGSLMLCRDGRLPEPEDITNASYLSNEHMFVEKLANPLTGIRTNCWDTNSFLTEDGTSEVRSRRGLQALSCVLGDIISVTESTLVFLHRDRWICTVDLDTFHLTTEVRRHFFIPPEWVSILGEVMCAVTPTNSLVFASKQDITIVKGWMGRWETDLLAHYDMDAEFEEYTETDIWVSIRPLR